MQKESKVRTETPPITLTASKQQRVEINPSWLTNFHPARVPGCVLFAFTIQNYFPVANCKDIPRKLYFDQLIFLFC